MAVPGVARRWNGTTTRARRLTAVRIVPATMVLAGALFGATAASAAGADTDQDGLFDQDEINSYLTDPNVADTDADGFSDGFELGHNMNPLVSSPFGP